MTATQVACPDCGARCFTIWTDANSDSDVTVDGQVRSWVGPTYLFFKCQTCGVAWGDEDLLEESP